jgi:hypothetical protein
MVMNINFLDYPLQDGYIHNWLIAGPLLSPLSSLEYPDKAKIFDQYSDATYPLFGGESSKAPADQGALELGEHKSSWHYIRCHIDHFVEITEHAPSWSHLRAWAYTQIKAPTEQEIVFLLTTLGPADVWVNGQHIYRQDNPTDKGIQTTRFSVPLKAGYNEMLVQLETVDAGDSCLVMSLQVDLPSPETAGEIEIRVPTLARRPARQQRLERILEYAYLEEVVNYRGAHFNLRWAEDLDDIARINYQIQDSQGRIYVNGNTDADPATPTDVGQEFRLFERAFWVVIKAMGMEFFEQNLRYQRRMPIYVLDNAYSSVPYGDFNERNREALKEAGKYENSLYAEIAKMEQDQWDKVNSSVVIQAIESVSKREVDSPIKLVGLLGMLYRYSDSPSFPEEVKAPLEACLFNFCYWKDEPGPGAMNFSSESEAILFHTAEILAGQRYPEHTFTNAGITGKEHRAKAEQLALAWLQQRGTSGFSEWNSPIAFERDLAALAHLTSLAENELVRELAAILMDKIFFLLAVNSYWGAFGSAHGCTGASMIKSAQLDSTSGITRMMWGMGVYNPHIAATVSLACSTYEFPLHIADIAIDQAKDILNTERHKGTPDAILVTYKTADYLLSSVQDYRPGEKGSEEHVWQATMGPEAVIFSNHPACVSEAEAHRPGWWRGNAVMPRVAQWKDVVIAVHKLPDEDWMGFTHAYFPIYAFEEHAIKDGWAFARKGDGYLAITASCGIEQVKRGPDGYRELRSYGKNIIWLIHMGRAAQDVSFEKFQEKILTMKLKWQDHSVSCINLRGEELVFGWEGSLLVNGKKQTFSEFKHIQNPYCSADLPAKNMDIEYKGSLMRLSFVE